MQGRLPTFLLLQLEERLDLAVSNVGGGGGAFVRMSRRRQSPFSSPPGCSFVVTSRAVLRMQCLLARTLVGPLSPASKVTSPRCVSTSSILQLIVRAGRLDDRPAQVCALLKGLQEGLKVALPVIRCRIDTAPGMLRFSRATAALFLRAGLPGPPLVHGLSFPLQRRGCRMLAHCYKLGDNARMAGPPVVSAAPGDRVPRFCQPASCYSSLPVGAFSLNDTYHLLAGTATWRTFLLL